MKLPVAGRGKRGTRAPWAAYILLVIQVQDIRVDPEARRVWRGEEEVKMSRKEYDLLYKLISNAGTIVSRDELMQDVWATRFWTSSKTIDVHLGWVSRKIGDDSRHPHLITTVRGKGLRFEVGSVAVL